MVQYKKQEVYNRILLTAKQEFLEKGFLESSMRIIAKKCNVSVSNMYNYFENKDILFESLVMKTYEEIFRLNQRDAYAAYFTSIENFEDEINILTKQISLYAKANKEVLTLLLTKSAGSKFSSFRVELKEMYYRIEIGSAKEKFMANSQAFKRVPSEDLIKGICDLYINILERYLKDEISFCELEIRIDEMNKFILNGIKDFLKL